MVNILENNPARDLYKDVSDMPSLPQLYYQIKKEVSDPNSTISRIGEVVSADQSLTARLLKLANSAFFGFPRTIDTITDAVSMIGLQQVRDLALCTIVIDLFRDIRSSLIDMEAFWRHSLGCGTAARVLAAYQRLPNIERFFVSGLIHDIGRLMMLTRIPSAMERVFEQARTSRELVYKVERRNLGHDHGDAGAVLMQVWQLPEMSIHTSYFHHRPTLAVDFADETALIHVADIMSHAMELGNSGEMLVPTLDEAAWDRLNLKPTVFASAMRDIERQYHEVVSIMLKK